MRILRIVVGETIRVGASSVAFEQAAPERGTFAIPPPVWAVAAGLFAGLAALICVLTARLSHDEEQYVAAAVLAAHLRPIVDFAYLQTPLQPLLLAPVMVLAGSKAFLACRLVSGALGAVACILAYPIVRGLGGGRGLAALGVVWLASSTAVQEAMGSARNDALPLALTLAGVALILRETSSAADHRLPLWKPGLAGVLLGAALCAKLTYVFAPLGGLIYLLATIRRPRGAVAAMIFAGGVVVGLLPLLYDVVRAPHAVLFDVVEFHRRVTPDWYVRNAAQNQRAVGARLKFWLAAPLHDPVLLAALGIAAWSLWAKQLALAKCVWAMALLLVLAATAAFAVNPPTLAYLAAPAALLILTAAVGWGQAAPESRRSGYAIAALVLLACGLGDLGLARHGLWLARPAKWIPVQLEAQSLTLAQLMAEAPAGPIATVSPIRILGAGRPIYPEFSAGPFVFRSGSAIDPAEAAVIKAATPVNLEALLARRPPAAILTGLETSWPILADAALTAYARQHGFCSVAAPQGARLFIRPDRAGGTASKLTPG